MLRVLLLAALGRAGSMDVVVAHHHSAALGLLANTTVLRGSPPRWIVYNKGSDASFDWVRALPHSAVEVRGLPNVGREGHTYLWHIVHRYDALADHTLFTQEALHPDVNADAALRLERLFGADTDFLSLGLEHVCEVDNATAAGCHERGNPHIKSVLEWATGEPAPRRFAFAASATFVASRECIRCRPRETYAKLLELVSAQEGHAVFRLPPYRLGGAHMLPEPLPLGADARHPPVRVWTAADPYFGHLLERLWAPLLACTTERAAEPADRALDAHLKRRFDARLLRVLHCRSGAHTR